MALIDHREGCTGNFAPEYAERLGMLDGLMPFGSPEGHSPEDQAKLDAFNAPLGPIGFGEVEATDVTIDGPHGPIPVRVYTPVDGVEQNTPALVWVHGGAFIGGDLDMPEADHTSRYVCSHAKLPVVSVFYRLANDGVHYPIPEDDVKAAYLWTVAGASGLPIDPERVALGGGSAGGCLTASTTLRLRDEGKTPWQALMVYPVMHNGMPEASDEWQACVSQLPQMLAPNPEFSRFLNANYVGSAESGSPEYAFPGEGFDLSGFPPSLIENCEFDELRASGERFATQLDEAGVDVEQYCCPGVLHGHLNLVGSPYAYSTMQHLVERLRPTH